MPDKFNNKTNGITQRRFLLHANPLLADWVTAHVGDEWITDLTVLRHLKVYADDKKAQHEFMNIKYQNKVRLAKYILEHNGIEVDPRSIFDVQVKRLHEYKRQLLNILHIMYLYNELKEHPDMDFVPRTFIFGAKAAAGYKNAKLTIKLINSVADVINNDGSIGGKIKVVFIEDYCVSNAELIVAAADVSEQISTASKEASGTGNMKFMLNGAVTIGTMDGANVEMYEEVGEDNIFIFGATVDELERVRAEHSYNPAWTADSNPMLKRALEHLVDGSLPTSDGSRFEDLFYALRPDGGWGDPYYVMLDFAPYDERFFDAIKAYQDRDRWLTSAVINTAKAGYFSSDRSIEDYNTHIWHLR